MKKVLLVILLFIFLFFLAGRDIWDKDFAPAALTADVAQPKEPQHRDAYVYISGAVRRPGVYSFPGDVRVGDVVHAAGDVLPYADNGAGNYAAPAADGTHIHIPYDLDGAPGGAAPDDGKVHLNQADERQLVTLPGIGPVMAGQILEYRRRRGAFTSTEELKEIKGIGAAKWEQLKDLVEL